jgi:hypothetical protein
MVEAKEADGVHGLTDAGFINVDGCVWPQRCESSHKLLSHPGGIVEPMPAGATATAQLDQAPVPPSPPSLSNKNNGSGPSCWTRTTSPMVTTPSSGLKSI